MGHEWLRRTSLVVEADTEQAALEKAQRELPGYGAFLRVEKE